MIAAGGFLAALGYSTPNSFSAGDLLRAPLGELTAFPPADLLAVFKGAYF